MGRRGARFVARCGGPPGPGGGGGGGGYGWERVAQRVGEATAHYATAALAAQTYGVAASAIITDAGKLLGRGLSTAHLRQQQQKQQQQQQQQQQPQPPSSSSSQQKKQKAGADGLLQQELWVCACLGFPLLVLLVLLLQRLCGGGGGGNGSSCSISRDAMRAALLKCYRQHNPKGAASENVEKVLQAYAADYGALVAALRGKYGDGSVALLQEDEAKEKKKKK